MLLPNHMIGLRRLAEDYRQPIKTKLLQLRQNFIERQFESGTRFFSDTLITCPLGVQVFEKQPLVRYEFQKKAFQENGKIISQEFRNLKGCSGEDSLVERFKTIAKKEYLSSDQTIMKGEFDFTLSSDKESIDYTLFDSKGEAVVRLYTRQEGSERFTHYYLGGQELMRISYKKMASRLEVAYRFFSINFTMNRNGYRFTSAIPARFIGAYRALISNDGAIEYFDDLYNPISLATFQKKFSLNGVNFILDSLLIELPKTDFVNSGNQSTRLIEELRNAQIWLINGNPAQLNLVRNLVEEYLQAAEKGLLIDQRPRN
jgi:hypothetical protein